MSLTSDGSVSFLEYPKSWRGSPVLWDIASVIVVSALAKRSDIFHSGIMDLSLVSQVRGVSSESLLISSPAEIAVKSFMSHNQSRVLRHGKRRRYLRIRRDGEQRVLVDRAPIDLGASVSLPLYLPFSILTLLHECDCYSAGAIPLANDVEHELVDAIVQNVSLMSRRWLNYTTC